MHKEGKACKSRVAVITMDKISRKTVSLWRRRVAYVTSRISAMESRTGQGNLVPIRGARETGLASNTVTAQIASETGQIKTENVSVCRTGG